MGFIEQLLQILLMLLLLLLLLLPLLLLSMLLSIFFSVSTNFMQQGQMKGKIRRLKRTHPRIFLLARTGVVDTSARQFGCQPCDKMWWKRCPDRKQVNQIITHITMYLLHCAALHCITCITFNNIPFNSISRITVIESKMIQC